MTKCYIVERLRSKLTESVPLVEDAGTHSEIGTYFREAFQCISRAGENRTLTLPSRQLDDPYGVAESVYRVLTSRTFSSYSRRSCEPLKNAAIVEMACFICKGQPIHFYYDIGGGYSAALSLEDLGTRDIPAGLSFVPNGLHVLCLAQIARFAEQVRRVYSPGLKMYLVIDNLVAHFVNDIPVEKTLRFCELLRGLIRRLGLDDLCKLVVESQHSALCQSDVPAAEELPADTLDQWQYENVLRFSGKRLSRSEAGQRQRLYAEVTILSEKCLEASIDGVHLTQRLGASTLPFRAFRGGSARIQTGRLGFVRNVNGEIVPHLLTSRNMGRYELGFVPLSLPRIVPSAQFGDPNMLEGVHSSGHNDGKNRDCSRLAT